MTTQQNTTRPATTARMLHLSFPVGIVLFALVTHFVVRPNRSDLPQLPMKVVWAIIAGSVAVSAVSVVLRRRVPRRNTNESADLFWSTATAPALITWMPLEAGGLLGVIAYMLSGAPLAWLAVGIALAGFLAFNPASLERP
jgi:NhaP-type Na+/H+ or K+/H+ antiporter